MKAQSQLNVGNSVIVKANVKDPDYDIKIEGWQGKVAEIIDKGNLINVKWDSITLANMPDSLIDDCEEDGLDWSETYLNANELERTEPRDTENDVEKKLKELKKKHAYSFLGEQGRRIKEVLGEINVKDDWDAMKTWGNYLEKVLHFPFQAEVSAAQDHGPLNFGDKVKILEVSIVDDLYGVIVKVRHGRKIYHFPLCNLDCLEKDTRNYQIVHDYAVWFANR